MIKKVGDYTIRELFEECRAHTCSCHECKFFKSNFCNFSVPEDYFCEGDLDKEVLDKEVNTDEESDVQPEKNDSSANLEARIEKLEKQVEELNEWRCRLY